VSVEAGCVRALRRFEGVCEVAELALAYCDARTMGADVDLDEYWDLAGPGGFRDALEQAYVVWVVDEE
jgi:hypothetical protein